MFTVNAFNTERKKYDRIIGMVGVRFTENVCLFLVKIDE